MDDLSIAPELMRLGLDNPPRHWESVFQDEFGVTTMKALELVGGDAYPILVRHVNHAWEKKKLQKLLNIENEEGEHTFKKQREKQVEKLKVRYGEVQKIHEEFKKVQSAQRYLDGRDRRVAQLEKDIREALLISPSTWKSEYETYNALIRQTQSLLDRVNVLLGQIDNADCKDVLSTASKGRALQGIFLSKELEDQIVDRAKLLKVPDSVQLMSTTHPQTIMVQQFNTKQDEEKFLNNLHLLGYSATVPSNTGGYWGVCIDTSLALDQASGRVTSAKQKQQDISYFSTVKYVSVPLASFAFSNSDLQLSKVALMDLKKAEGLLISNGIHSLVFQKACKTFFDTYGSHATQGPLHFGGSYTLKCSTRGFARSELLTLKPLQKDAVDMKFGVSCIVGPNESSNSQVDITRVKEKYAGRCPKTNQTFMDINIQGGPPDHSTVPEWKTGLVASNRSWSLIDRGTTLVPVWDIIQMNHSKQFEQVGKLTEALRRSWEKLTNFTAQPSAPLDQAEVLKAVSSWKKTNPSQLQQQLQFLTEVKQGLIGVSVNPTTWPMLYLSQSSLQQFLKSVVDHQLHSPSPSEDIKNLMGQLVERVDLNLLVYSSVDFPHRDYISQWLYNEHDQPQGAVLPMDKSAFLSFGRFLKQAFESMYDDSPKQTQSSATEQSQKSVILSSAVSRAFNLFRKILQECGQKHEDLFIATLLFPFKYGTTYEPVLLNSLSQKDLQYLCELFDSKCEEFFINHLTKAKIQAFLFNLAVEIYVSQSEIDVYTHQVNQHLQYLRVKLGKGIECELSDILNKFLSNTPVDWEELKFELSSMLGLAIPERGKSGYSIEKVLLTVAKADEATGKSERAKDRTACTKSVEISVGEDQESSKRIVSLFKKLDLSKYYPQKLSLRDALRIRKEALESAKCTDPTKLYIFLLQKIMSYDYQCRVNLLNEPEKIKGVPGKQDKGSQSDEESDGFDDTDSEDGDPDSFVIHPMDSLLSVIHCADDFLRQDLMARLVDCQLSIPLILPNPFNKSTVTLCIWAMKTIVREWKSTFIGREGIHECPLISYPTPIVTFIRFGKQERSKSKMMNDVISDSNHDHFFHHDCEGGNFERLLGDGLVEVCWYLPAGKQKDIFPDLITFLNLHGNAAEHPKQIAFLSEVSFITFALITEDDLNDETTVVLKSLSSAPGGVVLCTTSKPSKFKHLTEHIPKLTCLKLISKNADEIKKEVREKIKKKVEKMSSGSTKTLEKCIDVAKNCSIVVDERKEAIVQSQKKAQALLDMLKKHDGRQQSAKETMLPLQGRHLWQKWAAIDKEEHRQLNRGGMRIEEYSSRKQKDKYLIRKQQFKHVNQQLSPLMKSFIERLLTTSGSSRNYFLQYLKLYLNSHSRETISSRKHDYKAKRSKLLEFQRSENPNKLAVQECRKQMERLQSEIIDASLGLEHLLRELGQVYEALRYTHHLQATSEQSKQLYAKLPMAGADLLIDGYPLELMDGDAAHVPKHWVTAVLQEVSKKLGNPRVFVLSVLGLQSTGKSTLINTTFGLQFNVGAGRCTRGAFMQLLSLSDELRRETNCDYVLVVDTEGLRAPELDAQKTQKHDNELATFVIGIANETMINIYGETPGDMDDILQTAVHAFLRMKTVNLSPSCQFVHQNVGAVAASDKGGMGRSRFKDKLDKMTSEAAKEEECEGQYQYFSDVIRFNEEKDVHHFPGLWRGDPPMAPVNPGYSERALSLRSHLVKKLKPTTCKHLSDIQVQIQDLWNALLHEKFVFSFKNTLEISVYNSLEAKYVQWSWSFRSSMLEWEENAKNKIKNSQQGQIAELESELLKRDLPNSVSKTHEQLQNEMRTFFEENEQRDMLAQWQVETEKRLERLARELQEHAEGFCQELTSGHEALAKVKRMHTEYKEQLKKKVKDLVSSFSKDQLKTGVLSESEQQYEEKKLEKMFDDEWEGWIEELKKEAKVHKEKKDVEKDVQKSLTDSFKADEQTVVKKLKQKSFKQWGSSLTLDLKERHVYVRQKPGFIAWTRKKAGEIFHGGREGSEPDTVLSNPQHRECVEATTKYSFDRVREYLSSRKSENFNPTYTHELLEKLKEAIQERSRDHSHLILTKEYNIDMSLTACAYATSQFKDMVDTFQKQNDPIEYLNREMKGPLCTIFKNQYFQTADEKAAASTFCDLLKGPIQQNIEDSLAAAVFQDMKGLPWVKTKTSLKATILLSLGEALTDRKKSSYGVLDDYFCYLTNANKSLQAWIRRYTDDHCKEEHEDGQTKLVYLAFQKADELVAGVWKTVGEVTKATGSEEGIDTSKWLKDMCKKLTSTLVVSGFEGFQDLGISRTLQDIQYFKKEVKERLDNLQVELKMKLKALTIEQLKKKPYDLLYAQLCGCVAQCPFCKEQCDATIKDHVKSNVKHSVEEHRPQCLGGYRRSTTEDMVPDICSSAVGSNKTFRCKDTKEQAWPYKEYDKIYPEWSITVSMGSESSLYWKWFVGNYSEGIAKYYGAKDEEIPSEWKQLTWDQAKQDVKETYHI